MNVHLTAFALCRWPLSGGKDIGLALIGIDRHLYIEEPLLFRAEFAFFFSNQRNLFLDLSGAASIRPARNRENNEITTVVFFTSSLKRIQSTLCQGAADREREREG